jgi:hypothetical protein
MHRYDVILMFALLLAFDGECKDVFQIVLSHDLQSLASITNNKSVVNVRDRDGETPLMVAARQGDVEMVKLLLAAGADVGARNKGLTVVDQVESYLRRTTRRDATVRSMRRMGIEEHTIQSYEEEVDALGGTPERIKAWKTMRKAFCANGNYLGMDRQNSYTQFRAHENERMPSIRTNALRKADVQRLFSSVEIVQNELRLATKADGIGYFAVLDGKRAQNIAAGQTVACSRNGSLKLVGKDVMVVFKAEEGFYPTDANLCRFDVELKIARKKREVCEVEVRRGIFSLRKSGKGEVEVVLE